MEKYVTFGKMDRTWTNGSVLEQWVTLRKMGYT